MFCFEAWGRFFAMVSNWGNNTVRKIIKHVWRDGEVLRREGVITVEVVQALQRGQITFNNVPRDAVVWNVVQIKV